MGHHQMGHRELSAENQPAIRDRVRALLIDDDGADIALFQRLAAKSRHLDIELTTCRTVEAARGALARGRYDVVYVDYWLGFETSIAFVHDLARHYDVPSVSLTSLDVPDVRRVAFRAGAEAFLAKDDLSTQALDGVTLAVLRRHASV